MKMINLKTANSWMMATGMCLIVSPYVAFGYQDTATETNSTTEATAEEIVQPATDVTDDEAPPMPELGPAAIDKAREVLKKSAAAYKSATAMRDVISVLAPDPFTGGPKEQIVRLEFYGGTDALVDLDDQGYIFFSKGPKVYATRNKVPFQYVEMDLVTDLATTLVEKSGPGIVFPHFDFRRTSDIEALEAVVVRTLQGGSIEGYQRYEMNGVDTHEIYCQSDIGDSYISIDPETYFFRDITIQYDPDPEKEFEGAIVSFTFRPEITKDLAPPNPDKFSTVEFIKRPSVADLEPIKVMSGDRLPRITSKTPEGEEVQYAEDLDKINLLVYFSIEGQMSENMMKTAHELWQAIKDENLPVNLVATSTLEGLDQVPDEWNTLAREWVDSHGYEMPLLVDIGAMAADNHNIGYIPTIMLIDTDCIIRNRFELGDAADTTRIRKALDRLLSEMNEKGEDDG